MRYLRLVPVAIAMIALAMPASAPADPPNQRADEPLVIGHRGASGYRPEHTLAAYELAARMGADYIEPDLVATKDGALVARHENEIGGTTNVADKPEFATRRTTKVVDGVPIAGWFTEDFTLAELRTQRARERIPLVRQRNTIYDGRYRVPTLQEVIDLSERLSRELERPIGIYPETKHPTYFAAIGLPLEDRLVKVLKANRLDGRKAKVFVQSFETRGLRKLNEQIDVPLVALFSTKSAEPADRVGSGVTYGDLATPDGLERLSKYVDGVGPEKGYVIPRDGTGRSTTPTSFVRDAHRAGLLVHPYTFRAENQFLPAERRSSAAPNAYGDMIGEIGDFLDAGVDGFFTDQPDIARETVDERR